MRRLPNIVTGIVSAALGMMLILWITPAQTVPAIFASVPSSFYPNFTSGMLVVSGLALVASGILSKSPTSADVLPPAFWARFAVALILLVGAMYVLPLFGFWLVGIGICLITLLLMGENRWPLIVAISVAAPLLVWGAFEMLLGRPLP